MKYMITCPNTRTNLLMVTKEHQVLGNGASVPHAGF
jgi:hypothetical protein